MNPSQLPSPSFEIPDLQGEELPDAVPEQGEQGVASPEQGTQPSAPPPSSPLPSPDPMTINAVPAVDPIASAVPPIGAATPMAADDADIIEKEWVEKAKEIVERTRSDPHEQNKEINKIKAEYIKKRYNRDIKVNNE
jgi:hypothetical protein